MISTKVKASLWKQFIKFAQSLDKEIDLPLHFLKEEAYMKIMDSSHFALLHIQMPGFAFDEWDIEKETLIPVRQEDFKKILTTAKDDDWFSISTGNKDELLLTIDGEIGAKFTVNTVEGYSDATSPLPKLDLLNSVNMGIDALKDILGKVGAISDYLQITADPEMKELIFSGKSDTGGGTIPIDIESEKLSGKKLEVKIKEKCKVAHGLARAQDFISAIKSEEVELRFGHKLPMLISAKFGDNLQCTAEWYQAPKIAGVIE